MQGTDWTLETPKTYIVLGAHRSGTSFLANALQEYGVHFGTSGWRLEHFPLVQLNMDIIQGAGGIWATPPPEDAIAKEALLHAGRFEQMLQEFRASNNLIGCKDPRHCLTIEHMLNDLIDDDTYLIAIFRKPEMSAASMKRMQQVESPELTREYARRIIKAIKKFMGI